MSDEEENERGFYNFLEMQEELLNKGDELQRLSVIGSLPELLSVDRNGTITKLMPKIQQDLPNSSSEFNLAASKMFNILINMEVPINLVPQVLQGIENRDPVIVNGWMETLLAVIPVLKESVVKHDILKCAISKSQLSKAPYFRVSSCRILGKLSIHPALNAFDVKKDILPLVQSLCQDCFHEVRAAMCRELPNVAKGLHSLGDTIVKVHLIPILVELSSDENLFVRSIAIDSVVMTIPYLGTDAVKGTVIPLIKKLCTRSVAEGDTTYTALANNYRKLILNILPQLSSVDAIWFLDYYVHISKKGFSLIDELDSDPSISMLCRENCARSLPMVATMVLAEIPNEIHMKWYNTFKDLGADPCYIVRKAVASCFDEVVKILGPICKIVVMEFVKLLRDDDEEVLQVIVPKIAGILEVFAAAGVISRELTLQSTLDIGRALLKCSTQVFKSHNWRMKEALLIQFESLPIVMPSDFIHQHFTQFVLNATLKGRAKPVRSQAARTLLVILRYNLKENHRKWIMESINNQLCGSSCCYTRQMYVQLCVHAINIFSKKFFKDNFYLPLLSLADDSVSVVRFSVIKLCPTLKQMLVLPEDRALQLKLENILSKMELVESDIDVIRSLRAKLKDMRTLHIMKTETILEEKRRIDEEDKISKGRIPVKIPTIPVKSIKSEQMLPSVNVSKGGTTKYVKKTMANTVSDMPFLDHHFYIDAGVSFPKYLTHSEDHNTRIWTNDIPQTSKSFEIIRSDTAANPEINKNDLIISVENININSLTEKDLQTLEATTNITDDVKVNIQKISKRTDLKMRTKRYSCSSFHELNRDKEKQKHDNLLKRRSLNISTLGDSKIPVSSKTTKRLSLSEKIKSASNQNLNLDSKLIQKASSLPKLTKNATLTLKKPETELKNVINVKSEKESSRKFNSTNPVSESQSVKSNINTESEPSPGQSSGHVKARKSSSLPVFIPRRPIK